MSYSRENIQDLVSNKLFQKEEAMQDFLMSEFSNFFEISKDRIKSEWRTTLIDDTLSNRCDIAILGEKRNKQVLIVFELKLEKSLENYSNYDIAKRQLHKYCQDVRCPFGILLSEKKCCIFKYDFKDSLMRMEGIEQLPDLVEIENNISGLLPKKVETNLKRLVLVAVIILSSAIIIGLAVYYSQNNSIGCENIKGNITVKNGVERKIYHTKDSEYYSATKIDSTKGEKMFCNEKEAVNAGFRKSKDLGEY